MKGERREKIRKKRDINFLFIKIRCIITKSYVKIGNGYLGNY